MVKTENPRDADGAKICAWCGGPIQQSGVGRSKDYCTRLCRDRAYKQRRDQKLIARAYSAGKADQAQWTAAAEARPVSPSVETRAATVSPSVETVSPVSTDGETESVQVTAPKARPTASNPAPPAPRKRAESEATQPTLLGLGLGLGLPRKEPEG